MGTTALPINDYTWELIHVSRTDSRSGSPTPELDAVVAPGPSQVLTGIMGKLPEATSRDSIDQASTEFMFVNSKAARKRLVKVSANRSNIVHWLNSLLAGSSSSRSQSNARISSLIMVG